MIYAKYGYLTTLFSIWLFWHFNRWKICNVVVETSTLEFETSTSLGFVLTVCKKMKEAGDAPNISEFVQQIHLKLLIDILT